MRAGISKPLSSAERTNFLNSPGGERAGCQLLSQPLKFGWDAGDQGSHGFNTSLQPNVSENVPMLIEVLVLPTL